MIRQMDVVSGFLAACPTLRRGWDDRLRPDDVDGDAPTDIGYVANHLADCYALADVSEFPAAFAFLERCFIEGSEETRRDCFFILFPLWLRLGVRTPAAKTFEDVWLGRYSKIAWQQCEPYSQSLEEGLAPFLSHLRGKPVS